MLLLIPLVLYFPLPLLNRYSQSALHFLSLLCFLLIPLVRLLLSRLLLLWSLWNRSDRHFLLHRYFLLALLNQ